MLYAKMLKSIPNEISGLAIEKIQLQNTQHLFGWTVLSGGRETTHSHMLWTIIKEADYTGLCKIDVLGLKEQKKRKEKGKNLSRIQGPT